MVAKTEKERLYELNALDTVEWNIQMLAFNHTRMNDEPIVRQLEDKAIIAGDTPQQQK